MRRMGLALGTVVTVMLVGTAFPGIAAAQTAGADPADVTSLDGIIAALYDVISGPAGEARDWDRFHGLFIPEGARLVPSGQGPQGRRGYQVWTPEQYVAQAGSQLEATGFFERELSRVTEAFGNVVHVFSTYDSRRTLDGAVFARGINSIQLFNDGSRYWIVSIFWDSERAGQAIPERYLGG